MDRFHSETQDMCVHSHWVYGARNLFMSCTHVMVTGPVPAVAMASRIAPATACGRRMRSMAWSLETSSTNQRSGKASPPCTGVGCLCSSWAMTNIDEHTLSDSDWTEAASSSRVWHAIGVLIVSSQSRIGTAKSVSEGVSASCSNTFCASCKTCVLVATMSNSCSVQSVMPESDKAEARASS